MVISCKRNAAHAPASAHLPVAARHRQGAPAGKSSAPVLTLRQNVVGGVPCPPVGVTAGKYSFGMSYSVSVGRDALVPPAGSPCGQVGDARIYFRQSR